MLYFLLSTLFAQEPTIPLTEEPSVTMIIESHKDIEVYVAPIKMDIKSDQVEAHIDINASFRYNSLHWRGAKLKNPDTGNYESVTTQTDLKIYNEKTIRYVWEDCDYGKDPMGCSHKNDHYYLETSIQIDDHEIVTTMTLYSSDMIVVNTYSTSVRSQIKWIKQQEVTVTQNSGLLQNSTTTSIPKEELPLKWLIPANLFEKQIQQTSLGLWIGLRLD